MAPDYLGQLRHDWPQTGLRLYCDGGVIDHNPSQFGGTWAYCLIAPDETILESDSGVIEANWFPDYLTTNNQTEMYALIRGLGILPNHIKGELLICSDSQNTLCRAFIGWKWNNIPTWMAHKFTENRERLVHWSEFRALLLDGHPTKAQLAANKGKRGNQVSKWNVWCDLECNKRAEEWRKVHEPA